MKGNKSAIIIFTLNENIPLRDFLYLARIWLWLRALVWLLDSRSLDSRVLDAWVFDSEISSIGENSGGGENKETQTKLNKIEVTHEQKYSLLQYMQAWHYVTHKQMVFWTQIK